MALIKCPECNHEISEYAHECIYCGCPMSKIKELLGIENKKNKRNIKSEVYGLMSREEKALTNEICDFIEQNTSLVLIAHVKNFGYRKSSGHKMMFCFKQFKDGIFFSVKVKKPDLKTKRAKITKRNLEKIKETVLILCDKKPTQLPKKESQPKAKTVVKSTAKPKPLEQVIVEEENKRIDPANPPVILTAIISKIRGKSNSFSGKIDKISSEVSDLVLQEVMRKAIEQRFFKNEEEFKKYKFVYRFVPSFFGYTFSFRTMSINDAKVFFDFYEADSLIKVIKQYERIYNKKIIDDYAKVLIGLKNLIEKGKTSYSSLEGLTSTFSLVPDKVLDDCLESLTALESIK